MGETHARQGLRALRTSQTRLIGRRADNLQRTKYCIASSLTDKSRQKARTPPRTLGKGQDQRATKIEILVPPDKQYDRHGHQPML